MAPQSGDPKPLSRSRARESPMRRRATATFAGCAMLVVAGWPDSATAQVNCETIPAGPNRTDCYIGLSRINRERAAIAAGAARQQSDIAIYRSVTGTSANKKMRQKRSAR
jgi:hypothetical protein